MIKMIEHNFIKVPCDIQKLKSGVPIVIVDIDDILTDCAHVLIELINTSLCLDLKYETQTSHGLDKYMPEGVSWEEVLINSNYMEQLTPYRYAAEFLTNILDGTLFGIECQVFLVTSRGFHPNGFSMTLKWLHNNALPYNALCVLPFGLDKVKFIKNNFEGQIVSIVEDSESQLGNAKVEGIPCIKHICPWNVDIDCESIIDLSKSPKVHRC